MQYFGLLSSSLRSRRRQSVHSAETRLRRPHIDRSADLRVARVVVRRRLPPPLDASSTTLSSSLRAGGCVTDQFTPKQAT
ncbi:hypothetical protein L596_017458 [Steinernema carpocapsae]|uniref:Uncharacterized protein n=1 Tax=Steinernema carpocapsae TaxID=34508 RepID=A0A4U5N1R1_STECR|nr:hypothetical protein L596_017458 [Steinernema carpocapsae]